MCLGTRLDGTKDHIMMFASTSQAKIGSPVRSKEPLNIKQNCDLVLENMQSLRLTSLIKLQKFDYRFIEC